jgi:two-component system, chemotaxis family, chemotaxis protein CheY
MNNPANVNVVIFATDHGIGRTVRMALRGIGVRGAHLAHDREQLLEGFTAAEPHVLVVYVDGPENNDDGLELMRFIRNAPESPDRRIPIVACSQRRDLVTVNAVINAGGHEYVLFPVAGDILLKKIVAARQSNRAFIEQPDYVGPDRRRRKDKTYTGPERRTARPQPAVEPAAEAAAEQAVSTEKA